MSTKALLISTLLIVFYKVFSNISTDSFKYYFTAVGASFEGFEQAFYANNTINHKEEYMDDKILQDVSQVWNMLKGGDVRGLFKSSETVFSIVDNIDITRHLKQLFSGQAKLALNYESQIYSLNTGYQKNLLLVAGQLSEIYHVFYGKYSNLEWSDLDGCKQKYQTIGSSFGQFSRYVNDIKDKYVNLIPTQQQVYQSSMKIISNLLDFTNNYY
eukprot:403338496